MLKYFICPSGTVIETAKCLEHCSQERRCLSLPTLRTIVMGDRKWDGKPHVTNLLNGTLEEYLKITCDYAIKPTGRAYALLGSGHHALLENHTLASMNWYSEIHLSCEIMQGTADLITVNEKDDTFTILDYKTWGSFKVAKAIGLVKTADKKSFYIDQSKADMTNEILQLNAYRYMVETFYKNGTCSGLSIQATVRDGGVAVAKSRGITEPVYLIDVPIISNQEVEDYFRPKAQRLIDALTTNEPVVCTGEERWYGRKCEDYCDVNVFCPARALADVNEEQL